MTSINEAQLSQWKCAVFLCSHRLWAHDWSI